MRRFLTLLVIIGALPYVAQAQLSAYHDRAVAPIVVPGTQISVLGPIQYGQVRVCNTPASNSPCTPIASIFDLQGNALSVVGGNFGQLTTDVTGQFSFQCNPGTYQVQVAASASNTPQLTYLVTCPTTTGLPSNGTFTNLTVNGLGTFNGGVTATSGQNTANFYNLNNVKIIDGVHYTANGAGINQAMTDLGSLGGEVWVTSNVTATDAQITITSGHTLRVLATLGINAQSPGPILLGKYAHLDCQMPGGANGGGNITHFTGTAPVAMVQMAVRDGSLETAYIEHCAFNAGGSAVVYSNGVIDLSGFNDLGYVQNNIIYSFGGGYGFFLQDVQSGALLGSSMMQIVDNWVTPGTGAGGCLNVTHSATNSVILQHFLFLNNECQLAAGSSTIAVAPINFSNASAGGGNLRTMNNKHWMIQGVPSGVPSITINGLQSSSFEDIDCGGASTTCINYANNSLNAGISFERIHLFTGTNSVVDALNSVTITNPQLDYKPILSSALGQTAYRWGSGNGLEISNNPSWFSSTFKANLWGGFGVAGAGSSTGWNIFPSVNPAANRNMQIGDPGANAFWGLSLNTSNGAYQSKRGVAGCTTAASIGGICATAVTVTWTTSFADTSYSAGCSPSGAPTNLPSTPYIVAKANGSMTVNYFAITAAAASWGTIDCWAIHD